MKKLIKIIIAGVLGLFARAVVRRYNPHIVMISGSVGKTSTKDAVAEVLNKRHFVRKSEKSYNGEFGVPFTILGVHNPWANPLSWFSVVKSSIALLVLPNHYPKMLVLEVGADKPRDIANILKIATPNAVVITKLPEIPVHVEAYATPEEVREEEFSPALMLPPSAPLIISSDDQYAIDYSIRTSARIITYGVTDSANASIGNISFYSENNKVLGMQADINTGSDKGKIIIKGSVGTTQLLPAAAAIAVASAYEIQLSEAVLALASYEPPPGRGRLLDGISDSVIIDDSYNSSPAAVEEALMTLKTFPLPAGGRGRRIAVLGDMLELGRYSVMEHERIGALARDCADIVVAVGIRSRTCASANGMAEVLFFENSRIAAQSLPKTIQNGDVILVKGSQSIRMERIVEALLADPADSVKLVRQEREWKKKA
jgi:UDP-N-acetylmuramoyl-tripeptide--D-alanyl-D-alanine ligase